LSPLTDVRKLGNIDKSSGKSCNFFGKNRIYSSEWPVFSIIAMRNLRKILYFYGIDVMSYSAFKLQNPS